MLTATLLHSPQDKEPGQATGAAARRPAHTGGGGGAQTFLFSGLLVCSSSKLKLCMFSLYTFTNVSSAMHFSAGLELCQHASVESHLYQGELPETKKKPKQLDLHFKSMSCAPRFNFCIFFDST